MANGTVLPASKIAVGDIVMSYNFETGEPEPSVITEVHKFIANNTYVINDNLRVDGNETIYVNGKWIGARYIKLGDTLFNPQYGNITVYSIRKYNTGGYVYDFLASPADNVLAAGYVIDEEES